MATATYREIPALLASREEFTGNSMSARWVEDTYIVYSYTTPIATWKPWRCASVTDNRWGVTSGRHINLCKRHL